MLNLSTVYDIFSFFLLRTVQFDLVILTLSRHLSCTHLKRGQNIFLQTLKSILR